MAGEKQPHEDLQMFADKYEKVLADDPSSVAFIFLAQVLYKQGKVDKAINVLVNGLRYNKKSVTGRFLLGKIYYDRWMIDQARKEFKTVVELAPDNLAAARMLVEIYSSEESFGKAIEVLKTARMYHPHDEAIAADIRGFEERLGLKDEKETEFRAAREKIQSSLGNKSDAELAAGLKSGEREIETLTMAGLYIDQGLLEKACEVLEKILEKEPWNRHVKEKLEKTRLLLINKTAGFPAKE
jgi:tetratricopeptide (TPR) repeat protein